MSGRLGLLTLAVAAGLVAVAPVLLSTRHTAQLAVVAAYTVATLGISLLLRQTGRSSLGQGAFMALGGYTTAILASSHGVRELWTIPAAGGVAAAAGAIVGLVTMRLEPISAGVVTFGAAVAAPAVALRFAGLTGGQRGLVLAARPFEARHAYALAWVVAGVLFVAAWAFSRSRSARALRALRDSPRDAAASGLGRASHAALAFGLSGAYGGIAGSVLVIELGRAEPGQFPLRLSLVLLAGAAVGGLGSIWGALPAALLVSYADQLAGSFPHARSGQVGPGTFLLGAGVVVAVLAGSAAAALGRRSRRQRAGDRAEVLGQAPSGE